MDASLFSKLLKKHNNYRKEKKVEEGLSSVVNYTFYHPKEVQKFPTRYESDEYIKKISHKNISPFIDGNKATFLYWGKPKHKIDLVSELSFWSANRNTAFKKVVGEDLYHLTIDLPDDARLEYKIVVDGNWLFDPLNPLKCDNGIGSQNSYLVMDKYIKVNEIYPREGISKGTIKEFEHIGKAIEGRRMVYVYLPPDYEQDSDVKYPSIYVHDGGDYIRRANMVNTLNNLIAEKRMKPIIAVFINPINRMTEYMYNIKYSKLIAEEIIPEVDKNFNTIPEAKYRAIMGASLGGIISFFTAYKFPDAFKNIAGQSSSFLFLEKEITRMIENSQKEFNVYMDVGIFESLIYPNRRMSQVYRRKGCPFFYQEISEGHTWSNWGNHIKDALLFFWGTENGIL
ncbi:MAG: alpha/beta hydrolase-fold protein [Candidatus Sericytochromatia bacterium]